MRLVAAMLVIVAAIIPAAPAEADAPIFTTGARLLEKCQGSAADYSYCHGYLAGAVDFWSEASSYYTGLGEPWKRICLHKGVTLKQVRMITVKWLNAHPEMLRYGADTAVIMALDPVFRCRKAK